ncbi:MAG: hypothetical protein QOH25_3724 [Acidobacteriota bacterium]|jgi:hypothetical protein|nr:hypothetical protein [Acidobacteriota bacterium]
MPKPKLLDEVRNVARLRHLSRFVNSIIDLCHSPLALRAHQRVGFRLESLIGLKLAVLLLRPPKN